jgi:hypothetical protein
MADVYGVPMRDFDEMGAGGFTAFEAVVILKAFDDDGNLTLLVECSDGIPSWELLGMAEVLRRDAASVADLTTGYGEDDE